MARLAAAMTGKSVGHWPRGIVCRDVRHGLDWPDGSVAAIYTSHFIEHLSRDEARVFLGRVWRALVRGGVCRIVTPDLRAMATSYLLASGNGHAITADDFVAAMLLAEDNPADTWFLRVYRQHTRFDRHKWLYDGETLCALMRDAGFETPRVCAYLESRLPADRLSAVETRERIVNGAGVVVEATR